MSTEVSSIEGTSVETAGLSESAVKIKVAGIVAELPTPDALLHVAKRVNEKGYRAFDVHSPFPIHGMDEAMGLGRSKVGWITLACGLTGLTVAFLMQFLTSAVDYPLITGGKPYNSWQAWIVICFELMVLFAAFGTVIGMFVMNGLPAWYHPTLKHDPLLEATDRRFFIVIDSKDKLFEVNETRKFLEEIGGQSVCTLEP